MVSAPGQPFEVVTVEKNGVTNRVFKNAPATVRDYFDLARGIESTFLVYEDEEWTFDKVMKDVDGLAYALVHHYGVKRGDRVGIAMRNYPEWVISFAAILSVGAISVSLNAWWTEEELAYAITDSGLSVLIADRERVERSHDACAKVGARLLGVRLQPRDVHSSLVERWDDVVVPGAEMPRVDIDADTDATILYTSGTTGVPKGAVSTHGAISQTIMAFVSSSQVQTARREEGEEGSGLPPCFILIVPLFHVTGCIPVDDVVLRVALQAGHDVSLGSRARARAHRAPPRDELRGRSHPGVGSHGGSELCELRHVVTHRRRWRGRAGAHDARRARRARLQARTSEPWLWHDRDQRVRTGQLWRRLRRPIPTRPGRSPRS